MQRSLQRQRGIVLLVALTVLVAMSLAGVALMRSVDNTVVIAGNLSFKQASLQVSDRGVKDSMNWLMARTVISPPVLQDDDAANGYYSARPPQEPNWFADLGDPDDPWQGKSIVTNGGLPDASGNTVMYVVHRMCSVAGALPEDNLQECSLFFPPTERADTGSKAIGSFAYEGKPQIYYRVTTRVQGPRNNVTVVQTSMVL